MDLPIYQFSGFTFNPNDGEIARTIDGEVHSSRLAPQPATLLALLLESAPRVVDREEIKDRVWPDVEVELEQSLHSCIRQIRIALDDSATDPKYIRTVHRRGYQMIPDVVALPAASPNNGVDSQPRHVSRVWLVATLALAAIGVLCVLAASMLTNTASEPTKIAIVSFRPPPGEPASLDNGIAELLVAGLTNQSGFPVSVIGPTTTSRFAASPNPLSQMAEQLDVEYIINARYTHSSGEARILAEVIRAADGIHVWAKRLDSSDSDSVSAARIIEGLRAQLAE